MNTPVEKTQLTVLMSVYNGEDFLHEAMDSILGQTFSDFEFLIVNDGSTDNSGEILESYRDPRIIIVNNESNFGLIASLNIGLRLAKGRYIARMDCDDISLPKRFQKQIEFMDTHPEIGMCGTWFRKFQGKEDVVVSLPDKFDDIKCGLFINSVFCHSTVMMRHDLISTYDLYYDKDFPHAEDYNLWVRLLRYTKLANLPEVLLLYREHTLQVSNIFKQQQLDSSNRIRLMQVRRLVPNLSSDDILLNNAIFSGNVAYTRESFKRARNWLSSLAENNGREKVYSIEQFNRILTECWLNLCARSIPSVTEALRMYSPGPLGGISWGARGIFIKRLIRHHLV